MLAALTCAISLYSYEARVTEPAYDGDTVRLEVRLGFGINYDIGPVRLYGINAPERYNEGGIEARGYLRNALPDGWFLINSIKDERGKYGRPLVVLCPAGPDSVSVNEGLVAAGHAVFRDY